MNKNNLMIIAAALCSLLLSQISCKRKDNADRKTEIVYSKIPVEIPIQSKTGENMNLSNFRHKLNIDSVLKSINLNPQNNTVASISFLSCKLYLPDDDINNSLSNFSSMNIGTFKNADNKNYLYGGLSDIADTQTFSLFIPQNKNVKNLITENDTVSYRLEAQVRKATTRALNCEAELSYELIIR
jgi:hypothetical protein